MHIAKYISYSAAGLAMALAPLFPAFAQTTADGRATTSAPNRRGIIEQKKERLQERGAAVREQVQQKREQVRERLAEKRKQIIRDHFNRMMKRFDAALERIKKIGERIQSRIERAKANGKDVASAQTALDRAKTSWQEAKSAVDGVKGKLESVLSADDPKAAFKDVQNLIEAARDKIKAAHAAMVDAITTLKGVGGGS